MLQATVGWCHVWLGSTTVSKSDWKDHLGTLDPYPQEGGGEFFRAERPFRPPEGEGWGETQHYISEEEPAILPEIAVGQEADTLCPSECAAWRLIVLCHTLYASCSLLVEKNVCVCMCSHCWQSTDKAITGFNSSAPSCSITQAASGSFCRDLRSSVCYTESAHLGLLHCKKGEYDSGIDKIR